jgi:Ino eighty subunit 2
MPFEEEEEIEKANPLYTRWISDVHGTRVGIPEEWSGKHIGRVLYADIYSGPKLPPANGRVVQEID